MKIVKNDKIIHKFMGTTGNIKYFTSWDALMPVLYKCTAIWNEFEYDTPERALIEDMIFNLDNTLTELLTNNIKAIYKRIIDFITWYHKEYNI